MRLIDADKLKEQVNNKHVVGRFNVLNLIDNAPTVFDENTYSQGYKQATCDARASAEGTKGECKMCKYYQPYYQQFTNKPRGDGYCAIVRMTPEGMTTINCSDNWHCADFCPTAQK